MTTAADRAADRAYEIELLERKLNKAMRQCIRLAERRQKDKAEKGGTRVDVTVTVDQLMRKLRKSNYRCAVSGLPFWQDDSSDSSGPTSPSIDRIKHKGPYTRGNTRVVLLGVNGLRGSGSDADMLRIARGVLNRARRARQIQPKKPGLLAR